MELRDFLPTLSKPKPKTPQPSRAQVGQDNAVPPSLNTELSKEVALARLPQADRENIDLIEGCYVESFSQGEYEQDSFLILAGGAADPKKSLPRKDIDIILATQRNTASNRGAGESPKLYGLELATASFKNLRLLADAVMAKSNGRFIRREDIAPEPDAEHPEIHDQDGIIRLFPKQPADDFAPRVTMIELVAEPVYDNVESNLTRRTERKKPYALLARTQITNAS